MMRPVALPLLSLATALALVSCGPTATQNSQDVATSNTVVENAAIANEEAPVDVAAVPLAAADAPSADVVPLTEAATASAAIDSGSSEIVRVEQDDGWAWKQRGEVIRTASRDGSRVSYFRRGEDRPYLVQQGGRAYGYSGDKVSHVFGGDGRPQAPDASARREGEKLDRQARADHDRVGRAPAQPGGDGGHSTGQHGSGQPGANTPHNRDNDHRPGAAPTPAPTPTATPPHRTAPRDNAPRANDRGDRGGPDSSGRLPRDRNGDDSGNSSRPRP